MICYSILGPFFPREAQKKGVSDFIVGMIFGCYALTTLVFSLILGRYIVQLGAKFMLVSGMFISGGCTILFGLLDRAPNGTIFILMCFLVRSLDAVGFAAATTASFSILAKAFPNNIATMLGGVEVFTGLGLVAGPPIGGFLYQTFGYEVPFFALGCLLLITVPLNMVILPHYDGVPSKESFWKLLTLPKVIFLCLVIFSIGSCLGFLDPTMSLFVREKFNLKSGYVGLVFLGLALSYSLSSPLLGILCDKFPKTRKWFLIFGSLLTPVCYFLLGPVPILHIKSQLWMFVFILVLIGFCTGMCGIPTFPELLNCVYENGFEEGLSTLGLVSGLFSAAWSLGTFVGPTLGGFLYERLHFEWAAAVQGGIALIAGAAMSIYYIVESHLKKRSLRDENCTDEEGTPLMQNRDDQSC
ncbi:MFS-type transporter SLC18B1 isoform X1 [Latimeria chalumnae]|uniref:Solute carrier family 18 member B1 n=1 Tax=Latimeria chalumnae TaxID=7897 RepID=M3XJU9_LATCH